MNSTKDIRYKSPTIFSCLIKACWIGVSVRRTQKEPPKYINSRGTMEVETRAEISSVETIFKEFLPIKQKSMVGNNNVVGTITIVTTTDCYYVSTN